MDVVADINIDFPDVSGDLGMEFHFLIGQELARDRERIGKWRASNLYDSARAWVHRRIRMARAARMSASCRSPNTDRDRSDRRTSKSKMIFYSCLRFIHSNLIAGHYLPDIIYRTLSTGH